MERSINILNLILFSAMLANAVGCAAPLGGTADETGGQQLPLEDPYGLNDGYSHWDVRFPADCDDDQLYFDGRCRASTWFERFVTPGAVFVLAGGSRHEKTANGVSILEAPNARTQRVKFIASEQKTMFNLNHKYIDGYEVLSEFTTTQWIGEDDFQRVLSTIETVSNGRYQSTWWEQVTYLAADRTITEGSDHCYEDVGCVELYTTPVQGDGAISDECKNEGELRGSEAKTACASLAVLAGVVVGAIVTAGSAPAGGTPGFATFGAFVAAGALVCPAVGEMNRDYYEALCDKNEPPLNGTPVGISHELPQADGIGQAPSACEELGGVELTDDVLVSDCTAPAGTSGTATTASIGFGVEDDANAEDEDVLEITVYGSVDSCGTKLLEAGMCMIVS